MQRRNLFAGLLTGAAALVGGASAKAASRQRVVYHVSEAGRVGFALGNIRNHIDGTNGAVDIVLVAHGPALAVFRRDGASAAISGRFAGLVKEGVKPLACGRTLDGMSIGVDDLLDGFSVVIEGGVVKIAELQHQGYAYLRP